MCCCQTCQPVGFYISCEGFTFDIDNHSWHWVLQLDQDEWRLITLLLQKWKVIASYSAERVVIDLSNIFSISHIFTVTIDPHLHIKKPCVMKISSTIAKQKYYAKNIYHPYSWKQHASMGVKIFCVGIKTSCFVQNVVFEVDGHVFFSYLFVQIIPELSLAETIPLVESIRFWYIIIYM